LSPAVDNGGNGEPKAYTGLVGTHHRPSDDLSVFGESFLTSTIASLLISSIVHSVLDPCKRNAQRRIEEPRRRTGCYGSAP
jgi:meiotically up-regulated gene 157 (Mug157) protein